MKKYEYLLFDVAGTLLHKPKFFEELLTVFKNFEIEITIEELKLKHKLISELIRFPDQTNKEFYREFNSELLFSLGIIPDEKILDAIFEKCSYLPWEKFEDTLLLNKITLPMGIISNFNKSLKVKLDDFFGPIFKDILVSEELGIAKPDLEFYKRAIETIGIEPKKILYVGDSLKLDIFPANKLGFSTLLIDRDEIYKASKNRVSSLEVITKIINE